MALTKVTGQVIKNTTDVTVGVLTVTNTLAVGGTVSIGGTLTYEDVTNIDSVGLITARNGIVVGSGITLSKDGDIFATGVTTTGSLVSSGAIYGTTGTYTDNVDIATNIRHIGDTDTKISFDTNIIHLDTNNTERVRVTEDGDIVTQGLTNHSFNNDGSNAKVLEVSGGGGTGTYGVLNLSGNQNSSAVVGAIKFCNRENSNSSSGSNANSRRLASIDCFADTSDSNGGDDCGGYMRFVTKSDGGGGSERMRVTSSGNVEITDGDLKISTSGHGIDFSATSDSTGTTQSEILDDYEEGTWTPTIAYSSSGSATLSEALGFYTKIGRMVHVIITVTVSAQGSGSGNVNLGGLPFTTGSTNGFRLNGHLTYMTGFSNINSNITLYRAGASTHMEMFMMNSIGSTDAIVNVTRSNVGNNATIRAHATYYVD